ncbi:hypothetical protein E1212_07430 [Jiangella ureilytica]|uniref:Uncharacterized protein n=1 Tax=Jiangella ureilytica TaxID=2530374 RepID=A0A4R4RSS0_9ACTN|nr:hypothetical protein E1212_07430 [Jiangella ureilytica]
MLTGGTAACVLGTLPAGAHDVTAAYSGDAEHGASTATARVTVRKAPVDLTAAAASEEVAAGEPAVLTATLAETATGEVYFASRGTTSASRRSRPARRPARPRARGPAPTASSRPTAAMPTTPRTRAGSCSAWRARRAARPAGRPPGVSPGPAAGRPRRRRR